MARKNLDDFLSEYGDPGRCQVFYSLIIIFIMTQWAMLQGFNIVMTYIPEHHCKNPSLHSDQFSAVNTSKCTVSRSNFISNVDEVISCPNGWDYTTLRGEVYPASEFDLVCDRKHLFRLSLTIPYVGVMIGGLVFGYLSDKYGRKKNLNYILPAISILTFACAFAPNLHFFIVIRFFLGIGTQGLQTLSVTYITELFRRKTRTIISYAFGFSAAVLLPVQMYIIYFLLSWRILLLIQGILLTLCCIPIWFLPESVTWLMSKSKLNDSEKILRLFAKWNNLTVSPTISQDIEEQIQEMQHKYSSTSGYQNTKKLFSNATLRKIMFSSMYLMFINAVVNNGLSFSISALKGNVYTNYLINGGIQLVIMSIFLILFTRFGRVKILITLFFTSGILCATGYNILYYNPSSNALQTLAIYMAFVSRNLAYACTSMLSTYTSELLPTFLRSTGLGIGFTIYRLGSTVTPEILYSLNQFWEPLPQTLYGVWQMIAVAVLCLLPETFNRCTPSTVEDVEYMMRKSKKIRCDEERPLLRNNKFLESFEY